MMSIEEEPLYIKGFGMMEVYNYAEKLSSLLGSDMNLLAESKKGLAMFQDKFVSCIKFEQVDQDYLIEAKVKSEMTKSVSYKTTASVSSENEVLSCECTCVAGRVPANCKHSFALLHALEDYSKNELYLAPTEKLQSWHQPKPIQLPPEKCKVVFQKRKQAAQYGTPRDLTVDVNYSALFSGNINNQLLSVLHDSHRLLQDHTPPLPACVVTDLPAWSLPELTVDQFLFVSEKLILNIEDIWKLEVETVEQAECPQWKSERMFRLTASSFFNICIRVSNKDVLAKTIFEGHSKDLSRIPAVNHGIINEPVVRNFVRSMYKTSVVRKVGLVTSPFMPHLAASPDGIISNVENTRLLEIKCVYNVAGKDLADLAQSPGFCLAQDNEGIWHLKKSHKYFYQVQGQLALSNLQECVFVLYYKAPNKIHHEIIVFDAAMWEEMYGKITSFYFDHYLQHIMHLQ